MMCSPNKTTKRQEVVICGLLLLSLQAVTAVNNSFWDPDTLNAFTGRPTLEELVHLERAQIQERLPYLIRTLVPGVRVLAHWHTSQLAQAQGQKKKSKDTCKATVTQVNREDKTIYVTFDDNVSQTIPRGYVLRVLPDEPVLTESDEWTAGLNAKLPKGRKVVPLPNAPSPDLSRRGASDPIEESRPANEQMPRREGTELISTLSDPAKVPTGPPRQPPPRPCLSNEFKTKIPPCPPLRKDVVTETDSNDATQRRRKTNQSRPPGGCVSTYLANRPNRRALIERLAESEAEL